MKRVVYVTLLIGSIFILPALSYQGPLRVTRFNNEEEGLGFIFEGGAHGPLRLLASDTALYLLARYRHTLYTFNLYGQVLDSIKLAFCPRDFTYDEHGRFHILQTRLRPPQYVATYLAGQEIERTYFDVPDGQLMTEITTSPSGEVLVLSAGYAYRLVPREKKKHLAEGTGERPGRYYLTYTHIGRTEPDDEDDTIPSTRFIGKTQTGGVLPFEPLPLEREVFQFHADDKQGKIYLAGTYIDWDEDGEMYLARRLLVVKDGVLLCELRGLEAGHSSYDYANHDIAVAPNGNVYLWRTNYWEGFSEILFWRAVP
ncbi:hypothetical protein JXM67_02585 [candidate division WOR-3 bacterium]|nr:hypothetical protein [candidate division WOR-3 bacterium]